MTPFPPSAATDPKLPHDSLVPYIIGICSSMLVLVTLVVIARFWIRVGLVNSRLGADDWCILVAWILAVAFDLDPINQTRYGLGRHIYDLPPTTNFSVLLELHYFGEIIYYICVAMTKIAILILYLRLAVQSTYRKLIWMCMAFVIIAAFACVLASIFQCNPIHKAWDVAGTVSGHCINVNALIFTNAGLDIFQDALIYILPMKMLYKLQIPKRQKIALMMVFAVGGFVVITGIVRLRWLKIAQNTPDPSYNNFGAALWSAIESNIGVVCASLPHFKPLIDRFFPSLMGRSRHSFKITALHDGPVATTPSKRSYTKACAQSEEFELEHGNGWKKPYSGNSGNSGNPNHKCSATAGSASPLGTNSSEDHLSGADTQSREGGIFTSTTVVISHR